MVNKKNYYKWESWILKCLHNTPEKLEKLFINHPKNNNREKEWTKIKIFIRFVTLVHYINPWSSIFDDEKLEKKTFSGISHSLNKKKINKNRFHYHYNDHHEWWSSSFDQLMYVCVYCDYHHRLKSSYSRAKQ